MAGAVVLTACGNGGASTPTTTTHVQRSSTTSSPTSPSPSYAAVGDSLMWVARFELARLMQPESVDIHAVPGVTADDALYELDDVDLAATDALILSVGTNDALQGATPRHLAKIDQVAERVAYVPCVRWLSLSESSPDQTYNEAAHRVNAELDVLAARYPDTFAVLRWDLQIADHPEWLSDDGIHHSEAGTEAYAEFMKIELKGCPVPK